MPNSADKSADLQEESDSRSAAMSDPDLDDLGFAIPEFRVPSKAQGFEAEAEDDDAGEFAHENTQHIPAETLEKELKNDAVAASEASADDRQPAFDRAELVKTVRMDAFDRQAVERGLAPLWDVVGVLDDQRFAPDVLVLPPRVLTKKWQDGTRIQPNGAPTPGGAAIAADRSALATTVKTDSASKPTASSAKVLGEDATEALDLENDIIEEVKPPPKPVPAPAAAQQPAPQPVPQKQRPNRQRQDTGPLPPQTAPAVRGEDDDLSGIVQELLDEKKAKPQPAQKQKAGGARPNDKRANWFMDVFSEEYFRTLPKDLEKQTDRELRFIHQSLGLQKGARILDLACGFGRHSIALAQRDYEVAGLDISMAMLQRALAEAQRRNLSIKFIHGDMRELNFSEIFDACICWQTSFGYFDDRTNVQVAQGVARAVKPGGRFLVDVVNRDHVVAEMPSRTWWEGHECVFLEEVEFDNHTSILHTKRSFIYEDGSPPREFSSYIRLYSLHELRQLLHFAGFRVIEVSGAIHTRGNFLGPTSSRLLILAERVPPKE